MPWTASATTRTSTTSSSRTSSSKRRRPVGPVHLDHLQRTFSSMDSSWDPGQFREVTFLHLFRERPSLHLSPFASSRWIRHGDGDDEDHGKVSCDGAMVRNEVNGIMTAEFESFATRTATPGAARAAGSTDAAAYGGVVIA
mmetsp:Transcript_532/g.1889  ORF Transcript_532/g.1889 Transcript_532/m.1889 type:complete len:141 (+) Transcript_532:1733-2155(+)